MDLIDILWRQDIDLGIAKEFYDADVKKKCDVFNQAQVQVLKLWCENVTFNSFPSVFT